VSGARHCNLACETAARTVRVRLSLQHLSTLIAGSLACTTTCLSGRTVQTANSVGLRPAKFSERQSALLVDGEDVQAENKAFTAITG
jgi:hypothetical protein